LGDRLVDAAGTNFNRMFNFFRSNQAPSWRSGNASKF
jgi:hypothetical protein